VANNRPDKDVFTYIHECRDSIQQHPSISQVLQLLLCLHINTS